MKKRLTKDEERAVVGGVLAGFARYFDQDPVLYRVLAITFLLLTGIFPGVLMYLAAFIVMPKAPARPADYEINA